MHFTRPRLKVINSWNSLSNSPNGTTWTLLWELQAGQTNDWRLRARRKEKRIRKNQGSHCEATQLLLQFEVGMKFGQEQSTDQGQPKSHGCGQNYKEHQPYHRRRQQDWVSVIKGNKYERMLKQGRRNEVLAQKQE